jgi:hypothetical protein
MHIAYEALRSDMPGSAKCIIKCGCRERRVKNWNDALAALGYLLFCLALLLSAGFMIFEIVE